MDQTGVHFRLALNAQPEHMMGERSYEENVRWNKRLLMMMTRARLIRVEALEWVNPLDEDPKELAVVRSLVSTINLNNELAGLLKEQRSQELQEFQRGSAALIGVLHRLKAPCRALREAYGPDTRRVCGSCALCRRGIEAPVRDASLAPEMTPIITAPLVDVVEAPSISTAHGRDTIVLALRDLLRRSLIRRVVIAATDNRIIRDLISSADATSQAPYRIDDVSDESAESVGPEEVTIVLHVRTMDMAAQIYNRRGRQCVHFLIGIQAETSNGRWPFMHDSNSRLYQGEQGFHRWIGGHLTTPPAGLT